MWPVIWTSRIVQRLTAKINEVQDFEVDNFLDLCHTFGKCRTAGLAGEEEDIWNYCAATKYFFQQFVECDQKITNKGSKCNANWNPFPDTSVAVDEVEREQMKRAACRDFFGVDDCMREEVSSECGVEEWEEFKQAPDPFRSKVRVQNTYNRPC
uniref:DUF19 domain-containing protein n=1 Tax=Caenorhabditis japonica TaxID=281687 RepID=A0A8R1HVC9_CAEJA